MTQHEQVQHIRQWLFAHRNGVLADAMRNAGDRHPIIMGCQYADVLQLARQLPRDEGLAQALWSDTSHRECRMLAPLLMPPEAITPEKAMQWASQAESHEIADILCHKLLRHTPHAASTLRELMRRDGEMPRYTAMRLALNLLIMLNDGQIGDTQQRHTLISLIPELKEKARQAAPAPLASALAEEIENIQPQQP